MPEAGQFYVTLGIKGAEKAIGELVDIKQGMGAIKDTSLEAKAAILAAVYGLEQMMASSLHLGTNLTQTGKALGLSTSQLYKYGSAAQMVAGDAKEMYGAINNIVNLGVKWGFGGGITQEVHRIQGELAKLGIAGLSPNELKQDPFSVLQKLQKFALASTPQLKPADKHALLTAVVGDATAKLLEQGAVTPQALAKVPTRSDAYFKQLDRAHRKFSQAELSSQRGIMDFTEKHGEELANNVIKIVNLLLKLAEITEKIQTETHAIEIATSAISAFVSLFEKRDPKKEKPLPEPTKDRKFLDDFLVPLIKDKVLDFFQHAGGGNWDDPFFLKHKIDPEARKRMEEAYPWMKHLDITPSPTPLPNGKTTSQNTYNQHNHGVDYSDQRQIDKLTAQLQTFKNSSRASTELA